MNDSELMAIGAFARRTGLTASALRFYADAGLLEPAWTDPTSGYRFYHADQVERADLVRRLRDVGMPLRTVADVLDAGPERAARLVAEHIDGVVAGARSAAERARTITDVLTASARQNSAGQNSILVGGPATAAAIDQVLTATSTDLRHRVLGGVRFDVTPGVVTIAATDRYRLATRTLGAAESTDTWSATVDGADLAAALTDLRRVPQATVEFTGHTLHIRCADRFDHRCRLLDEPFPDYRGMLDALPAVVARVVVSTADLRRELEHATGDRVRLTVEETGLALGGSTSDRCTRLDAEVTGPPLEVWFDPATLYPAVSTAIGADLVIDLRGAELPATVRSADSGDLTTLVMPTAPPIGGAPGSRTGEGDVR